MLPERKGLLTTLSFPNIKFDMLCTEEKKAYIVLMALRTRLGLKDIESTNNIPLFLPWENDLLTDWNVNSCSSTSSGSSLSLLPSSTDVSARLRNFHQEMC